MTAVFEQILSKKMGVALAAMLVISQTDGDRATQMLIAGLAALHVLCQTVLDWKYPRNRETNGNGAQA